MSSSDLMMVMKDPTGMLMTNTDSSVLGVCTIGLWLHYLMSNAVVGLGNSMPGFCKCCADLELQAASYVFISNCMSM